MQYLELTHGALLDTALVATYMDSRTLCPLENAPPSLTQSGPADTAPGGKKRRG